MADYVRMDKYAEEKEIAVITLRRMIARGDIKGYKMPGSALVFLDREELDAVMRPIPAVNKAVKR